MKTLQDYIDKLNALNFKDMYENDFFLTWDKTDDELEAIWVLADALRFMREHNISTKIFESGLGISIFRDNSTRTRFSFASACNLLGLLDFFIDTVQFTHKLLNSSQGIRIVSHQRCQGDKPGCTGRTKSFRQIVTDDGWDILIEIIINVNRMSCSKIRDAFV